MGNSLEKVMKAYLPMTETAFYILFSLQVPRHGYGVSKYVKELTEGRINLGSGTIYGTLTKFQRDGMIEVYDDCDKKIVYIITDIGKEVLKSEIERIALVYRDSLTEMTEG